jgi:hypothetical protein
MGQVNLHTYKVLGQVNSLAVSCNYGSHI